MAKRENRIGNRWELVTCALAGHVTYAPDDEALAERLSGTTGLGEVWRCLRCGDFALGEPHGRGHADDAPMIMRGKALRQAIIIRALGGGTLVPGGGDWRSPPRRCGSSAGRAAPSRPPSTATCRSSAPRDSRSIR